MATARILKNNFKESSPMKLVLFSGFLITVYFNPDLQDPFNSPKFWLLMVFGSWLCGYLLSGFNQKKVSTALRENLGLVSLCGFVLTLFISALNTNLKFTAFFGDSGRRIGFVTYLYFAVYMIASYRCINLKSLPILFKTLIAIGLVNIIYGFMQSSGNDFVQWNNPYNSIITTFGNPNFASAAMAMFAIICFTAIFISQFNAFFRVMCFILSILLVSLIYLSNSRQGLISYGLGVSIIVIIFMFSRSKNLGIFGSFVFLISGLFTILGMLQIGPLEKYLYKSSVSVRGYYWRAGYEMLRENLLSGVGIDRYGVYFKQYREVGYPLNYGFDITSTNAHSIPIQLFATGGLFVGIFYIILSICVFYCAVYSIRNSVGNNRIFISGIFAAWISYQAQGLISIENIGLGIWGWIFGGVLMGTANLTRHEPANPNGSKYETRRLEQKSNLFQPVISGVLSLGAIFIVSLLYTADKSTFESRQYFNGASTSQSSEFYSRVEESFKNSFNDPYYKLIVSEMLTRTDKQGNALEQITKLHEKDPNNLDYLRPLALISESNRDYTNAIKFRKLIAKYDPWNAENFLLLGLNFKSINDYSSMYTTLDKIISIAPNHIIVNTAKLQLKE